MVQRNYKVGTSVPSWRDEDAQTVTFVVTDDCNLRCKYCYITHKTSTAKMSLETAKKFVDFMLTSDLKRSKAVIVEFIGGEPTVEIDLIDQISDYFKLRAFELNSDWYWNYRFSICTNGVTYSDDNVQAYINKNFGKISCSITLDGNKEKHDLQRVFPDGRGSYDAIIKNIPLWRKQFGGSTKVTFASDDLPLLKDSVISLWENGVEDVSANVVFEDVWKDGDDVIFEEQLKLLADYILDNELFDKYRCSLFDERLSGYYTEEELTKTSCGAGKMMAFGADGNIYPCIRYKGYSLNNKPEWVIGNVDDGIDMEKVRPFMTAMYKLQSDEECLDCEVAVGCRFCQGFNYDEAETPTNFYRAKYICKMHKARVRANDYYFAKLFNRFGISKLSNGNERKRLYFLLSDDYVDYCQHESTSSSQSLMCERDIERGLDYAHKNFYSPIFVHSRSKFDYADLSACEAHKILHIVPAKFHKEAVKSLKYYMLVFDEGSMALLGDIDADVLENCMLNVRQSNIPNLYEYVKAVLKKSKRVNVNITSLDKRFDVELYKVQLLEIKDLLVKLHRDCGVTKEVNLVTDLCFLKEHNNCKAGDRAFTVAPDGKLYVCSAFYSAGDGKPIGDVGSGITDLRDARLYKTKNSGLCGICDAYQCLNCVHLNVTATNEVNTSPSYQCLKGYAEREAARLYQLEMGDEANRNVIEETPYAEPMGLLESLTNNPAGYYVYSCI